MSFNGKQNLLEIKMKSALMRICIFLAISNIMSIIDASQHFELLYSSHKKFILRQNRIFIKCIGYKQNWMKLELEYSLTLTWLLENCLIQYNLATKVMVFINKKQKNMKYGKLDKPGGKEGICVCKFQSWKNSYCLPTKTKTYIKSTYTKK